MEHVLTGTTMQVLTMQMGQGESIYTESGGMAWMSDTFDMQTNMEGGLLGGLKRGLAGESLFMTTYTCTAPQGIIAFANEFPGKIIPLSLAAGESRICQKDAFMCAERTVQLEMHFRKKLGAGFFGVRADRDLRCRHREGCQERSLRRRGAVPGPCERSGQGMAPEHADREPGREDLAVHPEGELRRQRRPCSRAPQALPRSSAEGSACWPWSRSS